MRASKLAVALLLAFFSIAPLHSTERLSLLGSLTLLEQKLSSLEARSRDSQEISLQLSGQLRAARQSVERLRIDLQTASASLESSQTRVQELEKTLVRLEQSLERSETLSKEQALEISLWRSRARRRLVVAAVTTLAAGYVTYRALR